MERWEIFRKRRMKGNRGGWVGKRAAVLGGGNKRFAACPRSGAKAWRQAKSVDIVLAQTKSLKVTESYLLFPSSLGHMGQGLHCITCDIHILREWRWLCQFKLMATKPQSSGTVTFLEERKTKDKALSCQWSLFLSFFTQRCVKRYFA